MYLNVFFGRLDAGAYLEFFGGFLRISFRHDQFLDIFTNRCRNDFQKMGWLISLLPWIRPWLDGLACVHTQYIDDDHLSTQNQA